MEKHSLACQLNKQFIHRNLFLYDVAMFVLLLFLSVSVPYLSLFSFLQRIMQASAMKACFQIASATYFLRKDIKKYPLAQIIRG